MTLSLHRSSLAPHQRIPDAVVSEIFSLSPHPTLEEGAKCAPERDEIGIRAGHDYMPPLPDAAISVGDTPGGYEIYVCHNLTNVANAWREFQNTAEMTPFQRYEWLSQWFSRDGSETKIQPMIVLAYQRGNLRLLAPLAIEQGLVANRMVWLGQNINDYNAPLVDADWLRSQNRSDAAELWRAILHHEHCADYLHLTAHPSKLGNCLNPFVGPEPQRYSSDAHFLRLNRDWGTFYKALRSTKTRRRLREKTNRLKKSGEVKFRRIRGAQQAAAMVRLVLTWKTRQLDHRGARNPFSNGVMERQLVALTHDHGADALLRVYALEIDAEPVAITVALVQGNSVNFFISAFNDSGVHNSSAGTIMLVKLIQLAARSGYEKFDFSLGDEPYKSEWCDGRDEITHHTQALTVMGLPFTTLSRVLIRWKRRIKSNDVMLQGLQRVNAGRTALLRNYGAEAAA